MYILVAEKEENKSILLGPDNANHMCNYKASYIWVISKHNKMYKNKFKLRNKPFHSKMEISPPELGTACPL